jgi:hypothetical protein
MKKYLPLLFVICSGVVRAQSGEIWVDAGASIFANKAIGATDPAGDPSDVQLDNGFRVGLRLALNSSRHFGHEFQYAYNHSTLHDSTGNILPNDTSAGMGINQLGYNLLYYFNPTNENAKARPFVTLGVHFSDFVLPYAATLHSDSFKFGVNYGGGMKFKISPLFGWRFDVRMYDTGKPNWSDLLKKQSGILNQVEASVGFGFYF